MATYRKFPWQRNIRRVPADVVAKLQSIASGVGVIPVCTKKITMAELREGGFKHLGIRIADDSPSFSASVLPPGDSGLYSYRNRNGWEVKRTDLPMVKKSVHLGERPNYGDWSRGSFSLWVDRMVYQIDEYASTEYCIDIEVLRSVHDGFVLKFSLNCVLDRHNVDFDDDLLFSLNILQENTGLCGVDRSGKTRDEYIETTLVDWEIFPPGSIDRFLAKAKQGHGKANTEASWVIDERVAEFRRLSPERYILGKGGFNRYVGAVLPHGIVVFENIRYGNALYVLYENWEDVSQRSRLDLLKGTSADYERIPHVDGWKEQFQNAVRRRPSRHRR